MAWHGEEDDGGIGPKAYAQILETISRLKRNRFAPGMYATRVNEQSRQLIDYS